MMMKKIAIARERPDIKHLVSAAIKDANSQSVSGIDGCFDILRYLKMLGLSGKDFRNSCSILPLHTLMDHANPKIRMAAQELFKSRLVTEKKRDVDTVQESKKKQVAPETVEIKQVLKKPLAAKSALKTKLSKTSRSGPREVSEITQSVKVSGSPRSCPAVKNDLEMLELFDIAKKSADAANAKGLLAAKAETSICVETLSLLVSYPISSTAPETRRIMGRLELLTKHKDRKICNSAYELLCHWRQSIREQQQQH